MVIAIDIDGVLARFDGAFRSALIRQTGKDLFNDEEFNGPNWPPVWDWDLHVGYTKEESRATWKNQVIPSDIFWLTLPPFETTFDALEILNEASREHQVYFITTRVGVEAKRQTELWLAIRGMEYPTVIISDDKAPVLKGIKADFFIDDRLKTVEEVHRLGIIPEHLYLKDAPYNREGRPEGLKVVGNILEGLAKIGLEV